MKYDDNEIEELYNQQQNGIDQTLKKDILVVQGDRNAIQKLAKGCLWKVPGISRPFCNDDTNERRLRLLEFAMFNDLLSWTLLVIAKHPEDGPDIA